jgi:hypothetical protein
MLHTDDPIEPRPEQILFFRRLALLPAVSSPRCGWGITVCPQRESQNEIARFRAFTLIVLAPLQTFRNTVST